jgi:hypothetical protein
LILAILYVKFTLFKEKRTITNQQKRKDEGAKGYEDYDWVSMFENNCIDKLTVTVSVLDKYIIHKQLGHFRYKNEKVQAVKRSIASNLVRKKTEHQYQNMITV